MLILFFYNYIYSINWLIDQIINLQMQAFRLKQVTTYAYEFLLQNQACSIFTLLSNDVLHIRIKAQDKDGSHNNFQFQIRDTDIESKLKDYFENLEELKQYIHNQQHIRIDFTNKLFQIVAKGPTKKATQIVLAQFVFIQISDFPERKSIEILSKQTGYDQWIDHLASEIISIIQNKTKTKQNKQNISQYIKKTEIMEIVQQTKSNLLEQIQKNRKQIQQLKQKYRKDKIQSINQLYQSLQNIKRSQMIQENNYQMLQKQIKQIKGEICEAADKIEDSRKQIQDQFFQIIKEQKQKVTFCFKNHIDQKVTQLSALITPKEQLDAVINKIKNIGTKVEALALQVGRKQQRDILNLRLHLLERKIIEIQAKFDIQKAIQNAPKRPSNQIIPSKPISAESWVDLKCTHIGRVTLKQNMIAMNSFGYARLFGRILIKQKPTFYLKLVYVTNKIAFGLIDTQYKENLIGGEQPNLIYYQNDKKFFNGKKQEEDRGEGIKVGETVTIIADLNLGTIHWKVGTQLRHSWQSDNLRNNQIKWVPYIKLFDKGDKVLIVE